MAQMLEEWTTAPAARNAGSELPAGAGGGWSWRRLLGVSALGAATALAAVTALVFKTVVPPLAVIFVLLVAGGFLAGKPGRRRRVSLACAAAALYGVGGGFVLGVLGAPEEPREFVPMVAGFVLALVCLVTRAVLAIRGDAAAGKYRFVCKLHPGIEGVLNVS